MQLTGALVEEQMEVDH